MKSFVFPRLANRGFKRIIGTLSVNLDDTYVTESLPSIVVKLVITFTRSHELLRYGRMHKIKWSLNHNPIQTRSNMHTYKGIWSAA